MTDQLPAVAVIVVAAGTGSRLGDQRPKAFVSLAGRSILERALHSIAGMRLTPQVIVVAPRSEVEEAQTIAGRVVSHAVTVAGGITRQRSVEAGLAVLAPSVHIVLVHDAARPLTPTAQFEKIVGHVERTGEGAIPGLPVSDTIKRLDASGVVTATLNRSALSAVQTPQGFPRNQLVAAYAAAIDEVTDDAALLAAAGHPVSVVEGDPLGFKITTRWDLRRAEDLISTRSPVGRVGIGVDSHAFGGDGELWVAGLHWPGESGLLGHSDGDPVAHAITDALLAAAGLGDIGSLFGTADARFVGAHGDVFLRETRALLEADGFGVGNVSVQLIGNRPRFSSRRAEAERMLSDLLGAPVNVSATTTDGLGFTGRGEGLAAIATALVVRAG